MSLEILTKRHKDWLWPFCYIPRRWTAFFWGRPVQVLGNQNETRKDAPAPIGEPNSWQVSYFPGAPWYWKWAAWYVAYSLPRGKTGKYHQFRLGARWDDVDEYVNWPDLPTTRAYTGDNSQNTQNWK